MPNLCWSISFSLCSRQYLSNSLNSRLLTFFEELTLLSYLIVNLPFSKVIFLIFFSWKIFFKFSNSFSVALSLLLIGSLEPFIRDSILAQSCFPSIFHSLFPRILETPNFQYLRPDWCFTSQSLLSYFKPGRTFAGSIFHSEGFCWISDFIFLINSLLTS